MAGRYRKLYYWINRHVFSILPDTTYHNVLYWIMRRRSGVKFHRLNLKNPTTFSEKLQWLKTHGNIELKRELADKYDVREWVAKKIGSEHLVELIPFGNKEYVTNANEIDFNALPKVLC